MFHIEKIDQLTEQQQQYDENNFICHGRIGGVLIFGTLHFESQSNVVVVSKKVESVSGSIWYTADSLFFQRPGYLYFDRSNAVISISF